MDNAFQVKTSALISQGNRKVQRGSKVFPERQEDLGGRWTVADVHDRLLHGSPPRVSTREAFLNDCEISSFQNDNINFITSKNRKASHEF